MRKRPFGSLYCRWRQVNRFDGGAWARRGVHPTVASSLSGIRHGARAWGTHGQRVHPIHVIEALEDVATARGATSAAISHSPSSNSPRETHSVGMPLSPFGSQSSPYSIVGCPVSQAGNQAGPGQCAKSSRHHLVQHDIVHRFRIHRHGPGNQH